ncbi:MAG: MFS transporter [Gammaproteobacteria bacterium]|nr:MFS transporter [Gammaproteobacteria bacterium]
MGNADHAAVAATGDAVDAPPFAISEQYRRYVLGLLLVVGVFNFVDQQIFAILLQSIKLEFGFSDTQLGLLGGLAFGLFYATVGFPIAWMAERYSRRNIIATAVALWSAMTALCGLATGFVSLFLTRVGVAVGEAGGIPPSQSLVADYFPPERRGTTLAVLGTVFPIGGMIGFLLGGWVTQYYGWRTALMVVGLPGLLLALLVRLTLREPPRGFSEARMVDGPVPTLFDSILYLLGSRSWRNIMFGGVLFGMAAWGATTWVPAFFIRVHGMTPAQIGTWLAFVIGAAGITGALLGGNVTDRVVRKTGDPRWYMWISAAALLAAVPFAFFTYLWPQPVEALIVMIVPLVLANMFIGPFGAMLLGIAGPRRRAISAALFLFMNSVIGLGLGPLVVGVISDIFSEEYGNNSLRYSILTLVLVANTWAALHFYLGGRHLREDLAKAQ